MPGLHVRIVHGDRMIVNGAALHFLSDADLRITNKVRFVYGKQLMAPTQASTTVRRIYLAVQNAYVGEPEERPGATLEARGLITTLRTATMAPAAREMLDQILSLLEADECYQALKLAARIVRQEDDLLAFAAAKPEISALVY